MKIPTDKMTNGLINGETVWVCRYRRPDLNKKPLRNLPPTRVIVRCNSELPKNKRVYYSESHFSPVKENGTVVKSKVISPVDNTGYRFFPGDPVHMFDNEKECVEDWNNQLDEITSRLEDAQAGAYDHWAEKLRDVGNLRKDV